jgi:uncharacterized membrane protein YgdD (TMEM256/DUF423 family)
MLAADTFMIVFRFLHIVPGVLWVGSSFLFVGFIGPSAAKVGPSAGPLMSEAVKGRKVAKVITALGGINVVVGWILWFRNADLAGSLENWLTSGFGLGLTIGGILGTVAAIVGAVGVGRGVEHLVDLADEVAATGRPPTQEHQAALERMSTSLERHGKLDLVLVLLTTAAMATARYW